MLDDGKTAPAEARIMANIEGNGLIEIKIHEGRNRQVRRMCEAIGHPVIGLTRTHLGFLNLNGLKGGQYRELTSDEVVKLKQLAGIGKKRTNPPKTKP
jgi:pseudouridine synthase